jgi:predicted nucleic acid-binding protein
VLIDVLRAAETAEARAFQHLAGAEPIVIGDIVLMEVLRGASSEARAQAIEAWLGAFTIVPMLDAGLAARAAGHDRRLRGLGITPRSLADLVLASWCIAHAVPLLHRDRDFDALAAHCGLPVQPV